MFSPFLGCTLCSAPLSDRGLLDDPSVPNLFRSENIALRAIARVVPESFVLREVSGTPYSVSYVLQYFPETSPIVFGEPMTVVLYFLA